MGSECFLADGIYLACPEYRPGLVSFARTSLGANTFIGNHAHIPAGASYPKDVLFGVCTRPNPDDIRPGTSWFGHPPFQLPRRERSTAFPRTLTHNPSTIRYLSRIFWELLRFVLPAPLLLPLLLHFRQRFDLWAAALMVDPVGPAVLPTLASFIHDSAVGALALVLVVVVAKWVLLGRVREEQRPLWSCWASRWDLLFVMWNMWARPLMSLFEYSPVLNWWLRLMGSSIGRNVVLGTASFAQVVDPDMLYFEDNTTVSCSFQAHTFEDRVLKIAPIRVSRGASVGQGAVLMYGAVVGHDTEVMPHSVVMKYETLQPCSRYEGFPVRAVSP
eukprot:CAMPEP_0177642950 /NCGR_PEP_ID=MMETSP0447-20121125/7892_1 /TAXON_ID=0 /ORGANISM="Stygamoeba regulata, Strain BSH-02190019" /LENGTH=330 /DNA_ID=CAMNT_0019145207 /DNA_START=254 /DNA_END=1246 /DNA_ORIENTATION=-